MGIQGRYERMDEFFSLCFVLHLTDPFLFVSRHGRRKARRRELAILVGVSGEITEKFRDPERLDSNGLGMSWNLQRKNNEVGLFFDA